MLSEMGATVVITARSEDKAKTAVQALRQRAGVGPVSYILVDFLSSASIRAGAAQLQEEHSRLDLLVLNAGVGRGDSAEVWMANHIGPFLFTSELTSILSRTAERFSGATKFTTRVIAVSSGAHKRSAIAENPWDPPGIGFMKAL